MVKNMLAICFHCVSKHTQEHLVSKCLRNLCVKGTVYLYTVFELQWQTEKVYFVLYVLEYTPQRNCSVSHASFHNLPQRINAYKSHPLKVTQVVQVVQNHSNHTRQEELLRKAHLLFAVYKVQQRHHAFFFFFKSLVLFN